MRILYITNQISGAGGLERVLSIKASYLVENLDYEVHILTLNQGKSSFFFNFSKKIIHHDISVKGIFFYYLRAYVFGLKEVVSRVKPDIINVCDDGLKAFFLPIILGKPCPMIYERHVSKNIEIKTDSESWFQKIKTKTIFGLMNFLAKSYDRFVVLTTGNTLEWKLNNLVVIPNPLSFYPSQVASLQSKRVIAVGKQSFQKGYDRLLQSWKVVSQQYPEWKLAIYGTIDEKQNLTKLALQLNVADTVDFYPPFQSIEKEYLKSSVFVLSSRYEGFGMVLIEAMACGVPCVSFDCPHGPKDIISNEEDGFLVENGGIDDFAKRIGQLLNDSNLRTQMGHQARQNVQRFLPEMVMEEWDTLFKELVV